MLKLLLGHWKDHRRKPSLLPEDVSLPSNDPSRVNPIYEDSEGSVASSHHSQSEAGPSSIEDNPGTGEGVNLDLVDISNSSKVKSESEEAINHINRVLEDALDGESLKSSNNLKNKSDEVDRSPTGEQGVKNEITEDVTKLTEQATEVSRTQTEAQSEKAEVVKSSAEPSLVETIEKTVPRPLNAIENVQKEELVKMVPGTSQETQQSLKPVSVSPALEAKGKETQPPLENIQDAEIKSANLKTRAIDELIKKFQGQKSENTSGLQTVSSFLHSPDRKDIGKVRSPLFKNDVKKSEPESEQKKESLSNIFNFPPPPPLEPSKQKDTPKQTKTESSQPLPKIEESATKAAEGTTRSDSSLSRNITVSSKGANVALKSESPKPIKDNKLVSKTSTVTGSSDSPKLKTSKPEDPKPVKESKTDSKTNSLTKSSTSIQKVSNGSSIVSSSETTAKTEIKPPEIVNQDTPKNVSATEKTTTVTQVDPEPVQSNPSSSSTESISASLIKKDTKTTNSGPLKQKLEKQANSLHKNTVTSSSEHQDDKNKFGSLKTNATASSHPEETVEADEGVTRGDQVSEESSVEPPKSSDPQPNGPKPSLPKSKHPKEKKSPHRVCKHCKKSSSTSFKRGQCDDYYDVITGKRRPLKNPKSGSFGSDLSWEEKELIRKLRKSKRSPSGKSKHLKTRGSGHFRRHHPLRRSMSEDSTFNGSSICSCDDCWLFLVKDYAYGRASLRADPGNQLMCTCRTSRPDFLSRKVQFRSEPPIREGSTPTIPEEEDPSKKEDESAEPPTSDSNLSSLSKEKGDKKEHKRAKHLNENYRLVTPWELEEWDLARRKYLLMKRRKRARYMVFMALGLVVFIGLIVTILMVYLRRKTI